MDELIHFEYDFIIIAVASEKASDEIKSKLIENGVQEQKIVSPITFFYHSVYQKNLVDHIELDLLLNTEVLIFGMSYSLRGIDKELIKNKCFDFSWHSLDLYYNYKKKN